MVIKEKRIHNSEEILESLKCFLINIIVVFMNSWWAHSITFTNKITAVQSWGIKIWNFFENTYTGFHKCR